MRESPPTTSAISAASMLGTDRQRGSRFRACPTWKTPTRARINKGARVQSMIAAGSGLASGGTADNIALEASLEALARSGADHADLALVFVTADTYPRAHELLHAVRRVTGARAVLGCSGAGILTDRREVEDESAVAVLVVRSERLVATPFLFERQGDRHDLGTELARRIGGTGAEGGWPPLAPGPLRVNPRGAFSPPHNGCGVVPAPRPGPAGR